MKHTKRLLSMCLSMLMLLSVLPGINASFAAATVSSVVVSQAGYNANDLKLAYALSDVSLSDISFKVLKGSAEVGSGEMKDEGIVWGKHVYSIDFSDVTATGTDFKIVTNGVSSFTFPIATNIWAGYMMDFMAYYRMQRAGTDTQALFTQNLSTNQYSVLAGNPLVAKGLHPASHMDDAWNETKTKHYDLTGGWYDAGDFGEYSENQWVTGQMALTYLDNLNAEMSNEVDFDYDGNGIPDILDEVIFSADYALKMVDAFGGYGYNVMKYSNTGADDKGGWKHPEKYTDGIVGSPAGAMDDRYVYPESKSVEGSAKLAGTLAATARVLEAAIAAGKITADKLPQYDQKNVGVNNGSIDNSGKVIPGHETDVPALENFIQACKERALTAYNTAYAYDGNPSYPKSNYLATEGLKDPLLWAETELYLLDPANNSEYVDRAKARIASLAFDDIRCTSYWSLSSLAMQELYPAIKSSDATLAGQIQTLLESRVNYFISSANDTPYGVLNEFSNFGVNEPHISYVADTLRYYKLFKDINPALAEKALKAVKKGLYWVFGDNPWNTSWVSGVGTKFTKFLHSRLDEDAQTVAIGSQQGIIVPGAMACGPNMYSPLDKNSVNPWYQDVEVAADGANQWRFNEHSISIQIGLFYSVMSLSTMADSSAATPDTQDTVILTPRTGDKVIKGGDNTVKLVAKPLDSSVQKVEYTVGTEGGTYTQMAAQPDGTYTADVDISGANPLSSKRVVVRTTLDDGSVSYSTTSFVIAASYPSYQQDVLIDDFNGNGLYAAGWVCWWSNPLGSDGHTSKAVPADESGPKRLILTQDPPKSSTNEAQFRNDSAFPDLTGYQYLYVTLRNAGTNPNTQVRIAFDNKFSPWVTYAPSSEYTTVQVDMNALFGAGNPHKTLNQFNIQVRPNSDPAAPIEPTRIYVKDIKAGNQGTPPSFTFTNSSVDKLSGDEDTLFNFKTKLTIDQAINPSGVQIVIDGVGHDMMQLNAADTDFADGKDYIYSTLLGRGSHSYYFRTNDSSDAPRAGPEVAGTTAAPTAPKPAANVRIAAASGRDATLAWDDSQNNPTLAGYNVYMNGTKLNSSPLTVNAMPVAGLNGGAAYSFIVRGVDGSGIESEDSAVLSFAVSPTKMRFEGESVKTAISERKSDNQGQASGGYGKVYSNNKAVFNVRFAGAGTYKYTLNFLDKGTEKFDIILDETTANQVINSLDTTSTPNSTWVNTSGTITVAAAGTHTITIKNNQTYTGAQWWNLCIDYLDVFGAAPNDITNMAPADNANPVPTAAGLTWDCDQAASYNVVISKSADLSDPVKTAAVSNPTYAYSGLDNLTRYYWQITASNPNADTVSAVLSFTTSAAAQPGAFNLTFPAAGATNVSNTPTLTWEASSDATDYTVVISANSDMSSPVVTANATANSYQPAGLAYGTTYYWKVTANNLYGKTDAANNGLSFKTRGAPVRFYGKLATNANERKNAADWPGSTTSTPDGWAKKYQGSGEITWSVNFPAAGVYDFTTRVANDGGSSPTFKVRVDGVAVTSDFSAASGVWKDFGGSLNITTAGTHTIGIYNSSVAANTNIDVAHMDIYGVAPGNFTLKAPASGANVYTSNVTLDWSQTVGGLTYAPFGASNYTLLLADNSSFTSPLVNTAVSTTNYNATGLQLNKTYYWKVTAVNSNGTTQCGQVFSFNVKDHAPSLITTAVEAEDSSKVTLQNYGVETNATASGGKVIKLSGAVTGSMTYTFDGFTGQRDIKVYYFDENDGAVPYKLYVNGTVVDSWTANQNLGSANADAATLTSRTKTGVMLKKGDVVKVETTQNSGEWGRIDKLEFIFTIPDPTVTTVEVETMTGDGNFPTEAQAAASGGTVRRIKAGQYGAIGNATYNFNLTPGTYSVKVYYFDENDGSVTYKLYVNSTIAGTWTANQDFGTNGCSAASLTSKTIDNVVLKAGDTVRIEAAQNAEEWGRTDKVEFILPWSQPVDKPGNFKLLGPVNGAVDQAATPTLSWEAASGADGYTVMIATDNSFAHIVAQKSGITGTSFTTDPLVNSTIYYWKVTAVNAGGTTDSSGIFNFKTALPAPGVFTLAEPSDNAAGQPIDLTLSWNPSTDAESYTVVISDDSSFSNIVASASVSGTSWQVTGLMYDKTYYWMVTAVNATGNTQATNNGISFTTILPLPGAFSLAEPANNTAGQPLNPTLSWNPSSFAAGYTIQVSTDSNFTNVIANLSSNSTSCQVEGLEYETTYYWKVTASNRSGDTVSDDVSGFSTIPAPAAPGAFKLISPSDKEKDVPNNPVLTWEAAKWAVSYHILVSTKKDFADPVVDVVVKGTKYQLPTLDGKDKYYWKVIAVNSTGTTAAENNGIFFMTTKEPKE